MKKIKHLNTILIVLIMINYTLFSLFIPVNPAVLNEGSDFGKVSTNEFDSKVEAIYAIDTFGMGYAITTMDETWQNYNISYYDFNHKLVWSKVLGQDYYHFTEIAGSDQYLLVHGYDATIYDLEGTIISNFIIYPTDPTGELSESSWIRYIIHEYLICEDILYTVEIDEGQFLNNTRKINVILHSYNILTGELNWKKNLYQHSYNSSDHRYLPSTSVYEFKALNQFEQILTLETNFNGLKLTQFELTYDGNDLVKISGVENYYYNTDDYVDYIILSFDEIVWITETISGENTITTLESSRGPKLEFVSPYFDYDNDEYGSGLTIFTKLPMTDTSTMISGWVNYEHHDYGSYIGYLISDDDLSLNLFNLNDTVIHTMVTIDEKTVLTSGVSISGGYYEMIIWSFSKIQALNLINPYYINYLPIFLLAALITNIGYNAYKKNKKIG